MPYIKDSTTGKVYWVSYVPDGNGGWRTSAISQVTDPNELKTASQSATPQPNSWITQQMNLLGSSRGVNTNYIPGGTGSNKTSGATDWNNQGSGNSYIPGSTLTDADRQRFGPKSGNPDPGPGPGPLPSGGGANAVGGGTMMGAPVSPVTGMPRSAWSQALHDAMSQWVPGQTPHPLSPAAQQRYDPALGQFVSTAPPPPKWNPVENVQNGLPAGYPNPPFNDQGMIANMPPPPIPAPAQTMAPTSNINPPLPNIPTGQTLPPPPAPNLSDWPRTIYAAPNTPIMQEMLPPPTLRPAGMPMGPEAYLNQLVNGGPGNPLRKPKMS